MFLIERNAWYLQKSSSENTAKKKITDWTKRTQEGNGKMGWKLWNINNVVTYASLKGKGHPIFWLYEKVGWLLGHNYIY